ncbi:MAG: hypothetical protein SFU25_00090 [Candidatus Caenarcaniphilales bacterium]|nr:hypothetical protein [Candidatus Caenarcaniphilales bacterium]
MPRNVTLKAKGPLKVGDKWICRCGLSKGWKEEDPQPFCDGSHKKCLDEDETKHYSYDAEGKLLTVE